MRKWLLVSSFILFVLLFAACSSESSNEDSNDEGTSEESTEESSEDTETTDGESHTLGVAYTTPETGSTHLGMEKFKELVEEGSGGQITVELYPNGQLYASERESIEAVQAGNIEMTVTASAPVAGFDKRFIALDLPFIFPDHETAYEALDGELGQTLLDGLPEIGLVGLAYGETGMRHFTNNSRPIEKPEDMEGLKYRVMENEVHIDTFSAYGADASPFAFGELYSALQQNVYDGMDNPLNLIDQMKFYEVQDYLTISNHSYTATVGFMNLDFFEGLSEDQQQLLEDSAKEAMDYQRGIARQQDDEGMEIIKEHMEINELSPEQKKLFIDAAEDVFEKYEADIGSDLMELARSYSE